MFFRKLDSSPEFTLAIENTPSIVTSFIPAPLVMVIPLFYQNAIMDCQSYLNFSILAFSSSCTS